MEDFWNARYTSEEYVYGTQPNVYFKKCLDTLPTGTLLLPAEGEGRNAVYASSKGWEVHAFDFSTAARQKALMLARQTGVHIQYDIAELSNYTFPNDAFHAVGLIFAHMPHAMRKSIHQRVVNSLKPGGHMILEAFSPAQLAFQSGGPRTPDLLYSLDQLLEDFKSLEILDAQSENTHLEEGAFHKGEAAVVRLFAKKALH